MKKISLVMVLLLISLITISCANGEPSSTTIQSTTQTPEQGETIETSTPSTSNKQQKTEEVPSTSNDTPVTSKTQTNAHTHSYSKNVTASTCTDQGYTTYTCSCGDSYIGDRVAAKGHSYTRNVTAPTCINQGYTTYTCSCGDSYIGDEVAAKGHSYIRKVSAATCTDKGYTTYVCSCGDSYIGDETPAKAHSYTQKVTNPTCTERGYTTYTCSCGDSYVDNYVNPEHSYSNYVCTKCGALDKSNAYNYLLMWIKQNGKVNGEHIYSYEYSDNFDLQWGVLYNSSTKVLSVSFSYYDDLNTDSDDQYVSITLSEKGHEHRYYCAYGYKPTVAEAVGPLNAETFTANSSISCDRYNGNSNDRISFMEFTRLSLVDAVTFMGYFFDENIPELSIEDFGFVNFVVE